MDTNPEEVGGGQVSPEEALRQLVQLRMQLGPSRFQTVARQMGMPDELLDHIEQSVTSLGPSGEAAPAARSSGLLDASGRPIGGGGGGLLDAGGRPIGAAPSLDGRAAPAGEDE